jgi:hypothetical protein
MLPLRCQLTALQKCKKKEVCYIMRTCLPLGLMFRFLIKNMNIDEADIQASDIPKADHLNILIFFPPFPLLRISETVTHRKKININFLVGN